MVSIASTAPAVNSSLPLRRHIGQSFGNFNDQRIRGRDSKPVPGATVVTMPAVFASEGELAPALQASSADQNGNYESTRALAPGKYYVLAVSPPISEPLQAD